MAGKRRRKITWTLKLKMYCTGGILLLTFFAGVFVLAIPGRADEYVVEVLQKKSVREVNAYTELTQEQRLEDLDEYLSILETRTSYVKEMETDFGYSPLSRRDYYRALIKECQDDYQFVAVMDAIGRDVASCHSRFSVVDYDVYTNSAFVNTPYEIYKNIPNAKERINVFREYLCQKQALYDEIETEQLSFACYEGEYVVTSAASDFFLSEVISLDNQSVEAYLQNHLIYSSNPKYNSFIGQSYVDCFVLVSLGTKPVEVTLLNADGKQEKVTWYTDLDVAMAACKGSKYQETEGKELVKKVSSADKKAAIVKTDEELNLAYLSLPSFYYSDGEYMKSEIERISGYQNIVIDVRDNGGGRPYIWRDYVYPALFREELTVTDSSFMTVSNVKSDMYPGMFGGYFTQMQSGKYRSRSSADAFSPYISSKDEVYKVSETHVCRGNEELVYSEERQVYILVNDKTGSAADSFIYTLQNQGLATVVGTQTAGEGLIVGQVVGELQNSLLQYVYVPSTYLNADQKINNLYGTSPNVYVSNTVEDYKSMIMLKKDGEDISELKNREVWDTQYRTVCNIIKEKNE